MVKSDADLPYINQVLVAHGAKDIVYRRGPARKVQVITPSAPLPSPQSAVIRTLRPILRRLNASLNLVARKGQGESGDLKADSAATKAEDAKTGQIENRKPTNFEHGAERQPPEPDASQSQRASVEGRFTPLSSVTQTAKIYCVIRTAQ